MLTEAQKLQLLALLNTNKSALTCKFNSAGEGKMKKMEIWNSIYTKLRASGYQGTMEKLRDVEYQNIRKSTVKKRDAAEKSGEGALSLCLSLSFTFNKEAILSLSLSLYLLLSFLFYIVSN